MRIDTLDKAEVLVVLYNNAKIQGRGFMSHNPDFVMTTDAARDILSKNPSGYFDYLNGKVMKVNLSGPIFDTFLYNRDNGVNAAENAIQRLLVEAHQSTSSVVELA